MKVALYARVSTSDQTVENQKLRLIEYAKSQGFEYDFYEETETTRKTRPVKQKLLAKLRQGMYTSCIVYKLDRWARSSTELILDCTELVSKGIGFISLSDNLDFSTAAGQLQFQILAAFAQFERSLISERTKEGLRRAKSQGRPPGRPKGSKDGKKRKKSGYILREANKRKQKDEAIGVNKSIESYLD
ncbi:recombinase family protein [Draconibacterium sediminis]|uniref:recombinase family protein n=1 Tax=Draconibacterium sediminis TaxID=1544798 RepID=UPI0026EE1F62|nr:recombinase family protein [Draconibacterium sediminis]